MSNHTEKEEKRLEKMQEREALKTQARKRKSLKSGALFIAVFVVLAVGGVWLFNSFEESETIMQGDVVLPNYAYDSYGTEKSYRISLEIPDVLQYIPCYCGCGSMHDNIKECHYDESGDFDEHASFCRTCQDITLVAYDKFMEGWTTLKIREYIDDRYASYASKATTTPMPT